MNLRKSLLTAAVAVATVAGTAHAQNFNDSVKRLHIGSLSAAGTGVFNTMLEQNPQPYNYTYPASNFGTINASITGQQQYTTNAAGFVGSMDLQPFKFLGLQLNYGFTHHSERYASTLTSVNNVSVATTTASRTSIPTDVHEFTAAYMVHPKHIPFQPFLGIGGGYTDFRPFPGDSQWRETGLLETGFDIPTHSRHIAFRVEGRSLYYRSPNFDSPYLSTRSWRVTEEPAIAAVYKF